MSTPVLLAVLAAAAMHAVWNALVKHGGDPTLRLAVVALTGTALALPALPAVDPPAPASWPWLAASIALHFGYYLALALSYRLADLSFAYTLARGAAPPLVALGGAVAGDRLTSAELTALALISAGILSLIVVGRGVDDDRRGVGAALACGSLIAGYTLCDGLGVRSAGSPLGYILWLFVLDGLVFGGVVLWRRRARLTSELPPILAPSAVGGALSITAYGIVVWAMSVAPMALVSGVRETSVVLAALIGTSLLGEAHAVRRIASAALVCLGIVALKLA
jgi:drug/metabolite transporter (DMT)-like permease